MYKLNINRKINSVAIFEGQNIGWLAYVPYHRDFIFHMFIGTAEGLTPL